MISDAQSGRVIAVDWYLVGKTEDTRGEGHFERGPVYRTVSWTRDGAWLSGGNPNKRG